MKILIGTNNPHKFNQYKSIFRQLVPEIELLMPANFKIKGDPEEDCASLLENAIKKAEFFGKKSKIITIADDTGLFVDSLNGEPGLHTKRWHNGSDHDRCVKLLGRLKGKNRAARYKWAVAVYNPMRDKIWTFKCELEGLISDEFRDVGGFGYDKMFKVISMEKHYSELSIQELIDISGRGRAVKELVFNSNFL